MDQETYISDRVDGQLRYYEQAANGAKRAHIRIQTAIITLGILVPVIINVPTQWGDGPDFDPYARILITLLSLGLALLTGIANFRKYGDLWLTYRMTEELLKSEKLLFLTSSGKYKSAQNPFSLFVESTEEIISSEHVKFRAVIEESRRPSKKEES
jgi:hypothetical protein